MKKFLPFIVLACFFAFSLVTQMVLTGQDTSASKSLEYKDKFSVYESQFAKLNATTSKGKKLKFKEVNKDKIVVLNFWASWCLPCLSEFPSLNEFAEKYKDNVLVVGINNDTDDAKKEVKKIEKKHKLKFDSILDEDGTVTENFNISRIPATIIFKNGKVIYFTNKESNFQDEKITKLIEKNLK